MVQPSQFPVSTNQGDQSKVSYFLCLSHCCQLLKHFNHEIQNACEMSIHVITMLGCKETLPRFNDNFPAKVAICQMLC